MHFFIVIGILCVVVGLSYLYAVRIVLRAYRFIREVLLADRSVILYGRKIGLFFLLVGILILAQTYTTHFIRQDVRYRIDDWYRTGQLERAERAALEYLASSPKDERVLDTLARIYVAMKRYEIARQTLLRIKAINPERTEAVDAYIQKLSSAAVPTNQR